MSAAAIDHIGNQRHARIMSDAESILEKANADFAAGHYPQAADGYLRVIRLHPDVGALHINLGAALRAAGDDAAAERAYRDALALEPQNPLAWFNLGNLLRALGRAEDALQALRKADALQPDTPEFLNNLGVQLYDMGEIEDALTQYDMALAARPGFADALTNRGNALQRLGRMREAETAIEQALEQAPGNAVYRLNKSAFLAAAGRHADALTWADRAISADPAYTEATLKRASLLIQQGDLAAGFATYEARWTVPGWHRLAQQLPMPMWQGQDLAGKRLLVWNEQGFGDALLYARYLPQLAASGVALTLMCEAALAGLFRQSFGDSLRIIDLNDTPPDADYHVSVMSLPYCLGTRLETIPAAVPYLATGADAVRNWQGEIDKYARSRLKVGLVWAGNPGQSHDYSRSMTPGTAATLLDQEGVCFFNLLVGPRGNQLVDERLIDVRAKLEDFAATAALMQNLDLVISIDSAPAHLAGALGVPVWILLSFDPDSRYFLKTDASPWYPSATLFRQSEPGDWQGVLARLKIALETLL
jgi:tetratricopeptide (TPR) repeat protein